MDLQRIDTQRTYRELLELITTLALPPGEPLNEQLLAGRLNTTVTAVQEALKLLAHDGLVTVTARHGIYVAEANAADLAELSELRLELEGLAARLAAQRATADDLAVPRCPSVASRKPLPVTSRSASLTSTTASTRPRCGGPPTVTWRRRWSSSSASPAASGSWRCPGWARCRVLSGYVALVEAIRARDADRAERLMHAHVEGFYAEARAAL